MVTRLNRYLWVVALLLLAFGVFASRPLRAQVAGATL
jgi:hypothetical protein